MILYYMEEHEKKKEALKRHIEKLDADCVKRFGPYNKVDMNDLDPYHKYTTIEKFKVQSKVKASKCKFLSSTSNEKDDSKRFYKAPRFKRECEHVNGHWDGNTVNRYNKYEDGTCWVNKADQVCGGIVTDPRLQRPAYSKFKPEMIMGSLENTARECDNTPGCQFKQMTAYTYDCIAKPASDNTSSVEEVDTSIPPKNMPLYMFEEYLEDWYLHNKPSRAPKTSKLIGKGDRCNSTQNVSEEDLEHEYPPAKVYYKDYRELDYNDPKNIDEFNQLWSTFKNRKLYDFEKSLLRSKYPTKEREYMFEILDEIQYVKDYKVRKVPVVNASKMSPSIPQSVINMVLKRSAMENGNKRGILAWHSTGAGKCHAKDTPILMFDGSIKKVQDIVIGDVIMGDDSTPRNVLDLGRGRDLMFDIIPAIGDKYTVNSEHILCLKSKTSNEIVEIPVKDFVQLDKASRDDLCGYRVPVDFTSTKTSHDPYRMAELIFIDHNETTIPREFIVNDRVTRLKFLAGAIDTLGKNFNDSFQLRVNECIKDDMLFLCRSLGFSAFEEDGILCIYGNLHDIPVRKNENIVMHQISEDSEKQLKVDIVVRRLEVDDYYGFQLDGNHRYLLGDFTVTHNTAVATGVMDAFWDTDKTIMFVSSNDALASNPEFIFHKLAYYLYERFQRPPYSGVDEAESLTKIAAAFKNRKIRFMSFARLANRLSKTHKDHIDLDKCVLIIDEVHNLFRPLPNQRKQHELLEAHLVGKKYKHPNLKVIILTATPGDNVKDVLKLLNIVRDYGTPEITPPDYNDKASIDQFRNEIRGLISYLELSFDDTKFPKVVDLPAMKLPLSETQMKKYVEAYKSVKDAQMNYEALAKKNSLDKYWAPARKYANSLFAFEKNMKLHEFSSKIPAVIESLEKYPSDKHYLYSSFYTKMGYGGHGVIGIAKILEEKGYTRLTFEQAKKFNKSNKLPPPAKRFILVISTELGTNPAENLHELLKIYNHPDNKNGELIHIMLASNKYNESIDLKDVAHIHLFEPLVTMASEKQAIGRAVRFCSFANKDRSKGEWKVMVHRYMMDLTPITIEGNTKGKGRKSKADNNTQIENIDEKIFNDSREKFKELFTIYNCMKEGAIDCRLLKEFHEHTSGQKINCTW
jgi:hypothetical protein